jgi:hypothetical protein
MGVRRHPSRPASRPQIIAQSVNRQVTGGVGAGGGLRSGAGLRIVLNMSVPPVFLL